MTDEMALDNLVDKIIDEFKLSKLDLGDVRVNAMECTGIIIQKITVELIPIPKPMYSALVKNEKVGGRVLFKDENDRICFHHPFFRTCFYYPFFKKRREIQ